MNKTERAIEYVMLRHFGSVALEFDWQASYQVIVSVKLLLPSNSDIDFGPVHIGEFGFSLNGGGVIVKSGAFNNQRLLSSIRKLIIERISDGNS